MILLVLLSSIIGCDIPMGGPSLDGYKFQTKEFENHDVQISFRTHKSFADLRAAAEKSGVKNHKGVMAFSTLHRPDFKTCTVHVVDPIVDYLPEYIGHEITHCIYGRWHK